MNVWGHRIHSPTADRALAAFLLGAGLMGRTERRLLERCVTGGQRVVDVGANQGVFTLLLSQLVGPAGHVWALEPEPGLFSALDDNCRRNAAANVTTLQVAAGAVRSRGHLTLSRLNRGDNRLTAATGSRTVPVDIAPIDELLPSEVIDFVKIDVQGHELNVMTGMQALVDRNPAIKILFEYWPTGLLAAECEPGELLDWFVQRGFHLATISGPNPIRLDRAERSRLAARRHRGWDNLLASRD
jgi:FkbM family methyltransferase